MSKSILIDLTGQVFGRLTVLERGPNTKRKAATWKCLCSCGNLTGVFAGALRSGNTSSCGCLRKEMLTARSLKHGGCGTPEYTAWKAMWQRCTDPSYHGHQRYKNRTPPESWRDFAVFYAEVGPRPSPEHSLDRIKNHLPYGPGNVQWSTQKEQQRNRKDNVQLTYKGKTMCMEEWCEERKLSRAVVYYRLKHGWTVEEALTTPKRGAPRRKSK